MAHGGSFTLSTDIFACVLPRGKQFVLENISGLVKNSGISSLTSDVDELQDLQHPAMSANKVQEPRGQVLNEYDETNLSLKGKHKPHQQIIYLDNQTDLIATQYA